jgi:hypothetical protein
MRQTIDLLILDFSKAFDTMPHRRLHKIQQYGVEGLTNKWIGSWLCQRKQKVVLICKEFDSGLWRYFICYVIYVVQKHQRAKYRTLADA